MICIITLAAASYERYSLDYTWLIVWPAIAIVLMIYDEIKDNVLIKKIFERIFAFATVICVCTAMAMAIRSEKPYSEYYSTQTYDNISSSMMFWE